MLPMKMGIATSQASVEKGEAFYAMRSQLQTAIESGEQKATHPVWKSVAELLKPCTDYQGEDTAAELELVSDELAMRSEVEAVLEEMDEALIDLDVAKLGGATNKGTKLKLQKHPDDEIRQKYLSAVETYRAINEARIALLGAIDGQLDEADLENAVSLVRQQPDFSPAVHQCTPLTHRLVYSSFLCMSLRPSPLLLRPSLPTTVTRACAVANCTSKPVSCGSGCAS